MPAPATTPADRTVSDAPPAAARRARPPGVDGSRARKKLIVNRQVIVQVETSGCTRHCRGLRQSQTAEQRSTTVQALGRLPRGRGHTLTTQAVTSNARRLVQIQLGCHSHCIGSTLTVRRPTPGTIRRIVAQLLSAIRLGRPRASRPVAAREQAVTDQLARQLEVGGRGDAHSDTACFTDGTDGPGG